MVIYLAWMHRTACAYELQQKLCLLPACSGPGSTALGSGAGIRARMHQRLYGARHETVVDKDVLLNAELRIATFEVAVTVILHSMTQHQILSARRRTDRIGLYEAQPLEGAF